RAVPGVGADLAALDPLAEVLRDAGEAAVDEVLLDVDQRRVDAGHGAHLRDAVSHGAGADDDGALEAAHAVLPRAAITRRAAFRSFTAARRAPRGPVPHLRTTSPGRASRRCARAPRAASSGCARRSSRAGARARWRRRAGSRAPRRARARAGPPGTVTRRPRSARRRRG